MIQPLLKILNLEQARLGHHTLRDKQVSKKGANTAFRSVLKNLV